jgi:hypothetical protein
MEWTRLDVDGRVTALRRGLCAGVGYDGRAFTCDLRTLDPKPVSYDGIMLDSFGVVGASPGVDAWLTGRGADGRLHLIGARPEFVGTAGECITHSLEDVGAMWASPVLDGRASYVLASDLQEGTWRLRAYHVDSAIIGGTPRGRSFALGDEPRSSLSYSFFEKGPLVVAGRLGDDREAGPSAWTLAELDGSPQPSRDEGWRRVALAPAPTELTSVAVGRGSERIWVGGRVDDLAAVWEVLQLPFRGLIRSTAVALPPVELVAEAPGGRSLVLVEELRGDLPAFVAATPRGNRLCWHDGTEWKAHPAPDGRLHAACASGSAVHLAVDSSLWSVEDPTGP